MILHLLTNYYFLRTWNFILGCISPLNPKNLSDWEKLTLAIFWLDGSNLYWFYSASFPLNWRGLSSYLYVVLRSALADLARQAWWQNISQFEMLFGKSDRLSLRFHCHLISSQLFQWTDIGSSNQPVQSLTVHSQPSITDLSSAHCGLEIILLDWWYLW